MSDVFKGELVVIAAVIAWVVLTLVIIAMVLTSSVPAGRIVP